MSIIYITLHVRTTFYFIWNISDVLISLKVSLCNQKMGKTKTKTFLFILNHSVLGSHELNKFLYTFFFLVLCVNDIFLMKWF